MVYSIYTLTCPIDGQVKYVGFTNAKDLKLRLDNHLTSFCGTYEKLVWILKCRTENLRPIIEPIETIETNNKNDVLLLEKYWINQMRNWGFKLVNGMHNKVNKRAGVSANKYHETLKIERHRFNQTIDEFRNKQKLTK